ncbi:pig-B [Schizosaccharomyces cryophilus OY26]|uniref:Mannosyltransferase n=1 Tax=Schizosaccharomyces cryophilus (strain OY26 / ATCC MYA-4695 / CBS 11777 / NBRC 106824 / NRRL Y48691) TaxID=653667 RepID=S9VUM3_SCHCR|nr:pig-B [Schizosaccharomyces cryophilus OY26]EPY49795.1 pig-B [Schizosaccharomyces cryophilus OY26]
MQTWMWFVVFAFRWWNALWVKTFFQPDEFYQSLEVAHHLVFGYGFLTWEWRKYIRSGLHPLVFALLYRFLKLLGWDSNYTIMVGAPRILQGTFAAILDYATYQFALNRYGRRAAQWTLACSLFSFFNAYVGVRTFANSLETPLTALALWEWQKYLKYSSQIRTNAIDNPNLRFRSFLRFLTFIGIAFLIRPTNLLVWVVPVLLWTKSPRESFLSPSKIFSRVRLLFFEVLYHLPATLTVIGMILVLNVLVDRYVYGHFVFPIFSFFNFNVTSGLSSLYGVNSSHYYLSQAIPLICGGYLIFLLLSLDLQAVLAVGFVLLPYSFISHKEFRFVYPLSPILLSAIGNALASVSSKWIRRGFLFISAVHIGVAIVLCRFHQLGAADVMPLIHSLASQNKTGIILAPCHTTPWQSHIHVPNADHTWRFLTCEPFERPLDETDRFYSDMPAYLDQLDTFPDYLIFFQERLPLLENYFNTRGLLYTEFATYFNSWIPESEERRGDLLVYKKQSQSLNEE